MSRIAACHYQRSHWPSSTEPASPSSEPASFWPIAPIRRPTRSARRWRDPSVRTPVLRRAGPVGSGYVFMPHRGINTYPELTLPEHTRVGCGVHPMRPGRAVHLNTLIARHGAGFSVSNLLRMLSDDCPKRKSITVYDLCGVHCPELPGSSWARRTDAAWRLQPPRHWSGR